MEDRELNARFLEVFESAMPVLEAVKKGFLVDKKDTVSKAVEDFEEMMKSHVPDVEKIVTASDKTDADRRYVNLLPYFQMIAIGFENLIYKMETKVRANILFSEKGKKEIGDMFDLTMGMYRDTKDFILTRNPHLLKNVREGMDTVIKLAHENALVHQQRLITGVCMPQASYLYLDIIDSFKRIARALNDFAEKV